MALLRVIFEVDTDKPLGPQLGPWLAHGMKWGPIEAVTGISRRTLQPLVATSQFWEGDRVRTEVLLPPDNNASATEP
jgi:hypothetical protein